MKLSARNQFQGTVTNITEGQAMAEVTVKVGTLEFVAAITEGSVKSMGLKVNDSVTSCGESDGSHDRQIVRLVDFPDRGSLPLRRFR